MYTPDINQNHWVSGRRQSSEILNTSKQKHKIWETGPHVRGRWHFYYLITRLLDDGRSPETLWFRVLYATANTLYISFSLRATKI
jgi:hypothetical protein